LRKVQFALRFFRSHDARIFNRCNELAAHTEKERLMAYIEGAYEVRPGDAIGLRRDGRPLEAAHVKRIGRMELEVEDEQGESITLDLRITNEAIWERGRRYLEDQAGVHEPVPLQRA
jgi:hypothetical protein